MVKKKMYHIIHWHPVFIKESWTPGSLLSHRIWIILHVPLIPGVVSSLQSSSHCRKSLYNYYKYNVKGFTIIMKHYRAKPSAQFPKHMHILLHCCYKLVDNHLDIVPVCKLKAVRHHQEHVLLASHCSLIYDPE